MKASVCIAVSIVILIMILLFYVYQRDVFTRACLQGLWVGEEKFCQDSEIDGMMIYIGEGCESGYLIMYADNTIIMEKKFSITHKWGLGMFSVGSEIQKNVRLEDDDDEGGSTERVNLDEFISPDLTFILNPLTGCLKFMGDDDTLYAKLYRDNLASASV